jgi:orotidine-5'-phosphate decarboxylase
MRSSDFRSKLLSMNKTELIVALDYPKADQAFSLVEKLEGLPVIYKIGLELFIGSGPDFVREMVHRKQRIFLDLKLHDIPNTVARAAKLAAILRVEMLTLHLAGGAAMFRKVSEELSEISALKPKILGVSVLTSFDDIQWGELTLAMTGRAARTHESVEGLVEHAPAWGADGVVCSAVELPAIRARFPSIYTVVPGIRPAGFAAGDQARVMTPLEAARAGANAIVVGRPITESPDSRAVTQNILDDLTHAATS